MKGDATRYFFIEDAETTVICSDCSYHHESQPGCSLGKNDLTRGLCRVRQEERQGQCDCFHGYSGGRCQNSPVEGELSMIFELDKYACAECDVEEVSLDLSASKRQWKPTHGTIDIPNLKLEIEIDQFVISFGGGRCLQ